MTGLHGRGLKDGTTGARADAVRYASLSDLALPRNGLHQVVVGRHTPKTGTAGGQTLRV